MLKKRVMSSVLCITMAVMLTVSGCGNSEKGKSAEVTKKLTDTKEAFSEEDLEDIVTGLDDHYILEKAEDIDYLHNAEYDKDIVVKITDNGEKEVDIEKPGTYTVTYTVTVDNVKMAEYLEKKEEGKEEEPKSAASDQEPEASNEEEAASDVETEVSKKESADTVDNQNAADTTDIEVEKDMTVVDEDTAQDLADKGEVVWTDQNETMEKSDGTEVKEETGKPESIDTKQNQNTASKDNAGNKDNNAETVSSSGGKGGSTQTQTHTHNYNIPITKTVHHDAVTQSVWVQDSAAWDEPVYEWRTICSCGEDITGNIINHYDNCNGNYEAKWVQTDNIHHEATGHYENQTVQNAWDETVTTGYKCSCGAIK